MGLPSLGQKIQEVFKQEKYSEGEVLYLIIEMGKYLERSGKDLDPTITEKLDANNFSTIKFFRNWVAHPSIEGPVPGPILYVFNSVLDKDNKGAEETLFSLLKEEIDRFCTTTRLDTNKDKINWDSFFQSLKHVLAEQPVKIPHKHKFISVGFDESLTLKRV